MKGYLMVFLITFLASPYPDIVQSLINLDNSFFVKKSSWIVSGFS